MNSIDTTNETTRHAAPDAANTLLLSWLVGVATAPVLLGLVGGKVLATAVQELGHLSEELFRGDRLPLLHLSDPPSPAPESLQQD